MSADTLTILTCVEGKRCAKAYSQDTTQPPSAFDAGFLFQVEQAPIAGLGELAEALEGLRHMPQCMVIRDRLRAGAEPNAMGLYARRRVDRPNDPAPFEHAEHRWACFDADNTTTAWDHHHPTDGVERWRSSLPPALQGAAMVFQLSAKAHLSPTVRGHAWVWLSEPTGNVQLARWSSRNGIDPALFHAVQPHYTADPTFPEGTPDPLAPRALVILHGNEAVELDFTAEDIEASSLPGQNGMRLGSIALEEVGNPSELPAAVDARARVAAQLAKPFSKAGMRWDLCGHVGGACANLGLPPEECCAILEALRAGDVADRDFGSGLSWALGAYSFSARPLGLKGMRELLGPITTNKVGEALRTLATSLEPAPTTEEVTAALVGWGDLPIEEFDLEKEIEPINWVIEGLQLGPGKPTGLVSYANRSKTPYALELALHVALPRLEHFHGMPIARHVRALVLTTEGSRNSRRKFAKICIAHGTTPAQAKPFVTLASAPPGFLTPEVAAEIGERAVAGGYGLVIVDTYNSAFDGAADRNTNQFSNALKVFGDISDRFDVTFVPLLHTRKGDRLSWNKAPTLQDIDGHNSVAGALQAAIGLYRKDDERKTEISVVCIREVDEAFEPYEIRWTDTPGGAGSSENGLRAEIIEASPEDRLQANAKADEQKRLEAEYLARILAQIDVGGWVTWRWISKAQGLGPKVKGAREDMVTKWVREGVLMRVDRDRTDSTEYRRPPASPRAAEALAKRTGFLAGGKR